MLEEGGAVMWEEFMDDLRAIHIADPIGGANGRVTSPVLMRLTKAFLDVRAKMDGKG
jgi:hypothetical protein